MRWAVALPFALGLVVPFLLFRRRPPALARPLPGLPYARRITEGYNLSAFPGFRDRSEAEDLAEIDRLGIRAVVSLQAPTPSMEEELARRGIVNYVVPMGSTFTRTQADALDAAVGRFRPEQILIHCQYGVDRTGAATAYLLARHHGWRVDHALYSVLADTDADREALAGMLAERGLTQAPPTNVVSINSLRSVGSNDGMKARGVYDRVGRNLSNSLIDELGRR